MTQNYTAVIQKSEGWWIGWIQEVDGVNCQERTRAELLVSLKNGLEDILELNREEAIRRTEGESFEKVTIIARLTLLFPHLPLELLGEAF